ncbi:MAG TPA: hypothetical protein VMC48_01455 [Methanobacterium sp.]|nr:hypothetical protein [Methanobacterium sp.]
MSQDTEEPSKKGDVHSEKKKTGGSFLKDLKNSLTGDIPQKSENKTKEPVSNTASSKGKTVDSPEKKSKKGQVPEKPEDDPTIHLFKNLKEHEKLNSLRKRKSTIIKITASIVSVILIIIGIIYSLVPDERVASNVIFGERAMFSVFLILVALMILAAAFASKLLEGKYLRNIRRDLEVVEGKKSKAEKKNSGTDPITERRDKKKK